MFLTDVYICVVLLNFSFFFFQAEDGIRDTSVTGVQTCALPICVPPRSEEFVELLIKYPRLADGEGVERGDRRQPRSEERRVGKECRSRWWGGEDRKK